MSKVMFKIHHDVHVSVEITEEKKQLIVDRILKFCQEENCVSGESLHQDDDAIINSPSVLSDIIDDILKFDVKWEEEEDHY